MAKSFYNKEDPNTVLAGNEQIKQRGRNKTRETLPPEPSTDYKPTKRKPGRPITKNVKNTCKTVNIAIPITLLDRWEEVKMVHENNLTAYIIKLIQKDMDSNFDKYINIINTLKDI